MTLKTLKKIITIFLIQLGCVGCDQVTKDMARHNLADVGVLRFWADTLRVQYTENTGGFLSLGATIPDHLRFLVFTGMVGGFLLALMIYVLTAKRLNRASSLALSLILAGGIGNLIDRVCNNGRVVDFLNLGIGPLRTGIFNVADVAITGGILLLVWLSMSRSRDNKFDSRSG